MTTNLRSTTTYFVGTHYEVTGSEVTKYYYAGSQRIAMRKDGDLFFIIGDHLGSTSIVTDDEGTVISETKYKAWGEIRYSSGTNPSQYTYTGQYSYASDFGLHFYNARWYDSSLGRFAQADTIVPSGIQGLDRYAYVNNSPLNYIDPSGNIPIDCFEESYCNKSFETKFSLLFFPDAERIAKKRGRNDTLEAMARIVESAAEVYDGNWEDMMQALGMVFLGLPANQGPYSGPGTLEYGNKITDADYDQIYKSPYNLGKYFKDGGFNAHYQDGTNQIVHAWGFIANTTILHGNSYHRAAANFNSTVANNIHEFFPDNGFGDSRQDFMLSRAGMVIGNQITNGEITPYELGDVLRTNLGEDAVVDNGFVWQYWVLPDAQVQP